MQEYKLVLNGGISVYFSVCTKEKLARSACLVQGNFSLVRQPGPCANLALTDSHKVEHLDREMGKGKKKKKDLQKEMHLCSDSVHCSISVYA